MRGYSFVKKVFVFLYPGTSGGAGTLSIRLGKFLVNLGYEVIYICEEVTDDYNMKIMKENGIKVLELRKKDIIQGLCRHTNNFNLTFLTYRLDEFLFVETLKRQLTIDNNFLYTISNNGLIKGENYNKAIQIITKSFIKSIIKKADLNNSIIYPANQTIELMQNYYNLELDQNREKVLRLPMEIKEFDVEVIKGKKSLECFNMIAILRADFPFLGYVVGLIKDFEKIYKANNKVTLSIISRGKGFTEIRNTIETLEVEVQTKIDLIEGVPYEQLGEYFNKSHLNIGQGTTVLDAANHGVPSLIIKENSYECLTKGFYNRESDYLCAQRHEEVEPIFNYVDKLMRLTEIEYLELCNNTYQSLRDNNSIENFTSRLLEIQNVKKYRVFSKQDFFKMDLLENTHKIIKKLNLIRKGFVSKES